MRIYRKEMGDILKDLPSIEPLNIQKCPDIFIASLGFEDRSHAIVDAFSKSPCSGNSCLLLVEYPTNREENLKNMKYFETAAATMLGFDRIEFQRRSFILNLRQKLDQFIQKGHFSVFFDISTCSSYIFYPTMHELMKSNADLTIVYAEADTYYPTKEEWQAVDEKAKQEATLFIQSFENAKFQSTGVSEVYPYSPYSEFNAGNKPSTLVAVPNFSVKRMNAIANRDRELNKTPQDKTIWIIGEPPAHQNKWRAEAIVRTHNLTNEHYHCVSTFEYKEMMTALEAVWNKHKYSYHITIGSLGSKMQHLGTYLFLSLHKEIGLLLAEPQEFKADRFSQGVGPLWQINFGDFGRIRELFNDYMTFEWEF